MHTKNTKRRFYEYEGSFKVRFSGKFWEKRYHNGREKIIEEILHNELKKCDCEFILDAGCGTGEMAKILNTLGKKVVGLDISSTYLKRSKEYIKILVNGDMESLPFKSEAFDLVFCADALEHTQDFDQAVNELFRVGKKCILVTTPNEGLLRQIFRAGATSKLKQIDLKVGHNHIFSLHQLCNRLSKNGWIIAYHRTFHVIQPITDKILPPQLEKIIFNLERIANVVLPNLGTVSAVLLCQKR